MSTLVLQAAGTALGSLLGGPVGGPIVGALGGAIGAGAGGLIDGAIAGRLGKTRRVEGPRLTTLAGLGSQEGAPIPRVYGRARVGGQVIWATRFVEEASVRKTRAGGKSSGATGQKTVTTTYSYYANIAVGLCEGPIAFVRRVWAEGRELDLTGLTMRVHSGSQDQPADPLIVAKEGADAAPAYRGTAYVVFERLPLAPFGNRVPQLSFEVVRPVPGPGRQLKAMHVIPGAGEFVLAPTLVTRVEGPSTRAENRHVLTHSSDWHASIDALQALCPALRHVSLVVCWFGDDLRVDRCTIAPRVETARRTTRRGRWLVSGLERAQTRAVTQSGGRPASGGTPSDFSVVAAIRDLKARGFEVTLYPFIAMDIAADNGLADPLTGGASQPPYPWRGRITCAPAPGRTGSPDGTAGIAASVARFFGVAATGHFAWDGLTVDYSGPPEWSFRRHILHCAALARQAGGVDAFIIGSELVGITRLRSGPGVYPAAQELARLAKDVRAMLGPGVKLTYAADWTEYGAHVPAEGEVRFPLDPLWTSPAIDAVGIDAWWPLTDWRDGTLHRDHDLASGPANPDHLADRVTAGEAFDWFYADAAAREAQDRTPIADAAGSPWLFRAKDVAGWWGSPHVERVAGQAAGGTAWRPGSKPVWLTEFGCPAIDRAGNGPNAFPDPKSAEERLPPFSGGGRDDLVQARVIEAMLRRYDSSRPDHVPLPRPAGGPDPDGMVPPDRIYAWCWDARPFPAFPAMQDVWADGSAWATGHWLTGRLEGAPVEAIVRAMLAEAGLTAAFEGVDGFCQGYVVDRPMSLRAVLEPLAALYGFELAAGAGGLRFVGRGARRVLALSQDDLVPGKEGNLVTRSRAQETELPHALTLAYIDGEGDFRAAVASSRRLAGASRRETSLTAAAALDKAQAVALAEAALHEAWVGRETAEFTLRPGLVALEVGDVVRLPDAALGLMRIERITDGPARAIVARAIEPALAAPAPGPGVPRRASAPEVADAPAVTVIDWPGANADPPVLQSLAVAARPWPGAVGIWRSQDGASFDLLGVAETAARTGVTLAPLGPGPLWRFDDAATLPVRLDLGSLQASGDLAALDGRNALALRHGEGLWEVVGFARADLTAEATWAVGRLLRGLAGSEALASRILPAGSQVVVVDASLVAIGSGSDALGAEWQYRVGPADRDVGDEAMTSLAAAPGPLALRPLAPVRLTARRTPAGILLGWIRRGRVSADPWEPVDIPLGETAEIYAVDVLRDGTTIRRLDAVAQQVLYPAASEIADFGRAVTVLAVRVAQLSASVGPGPAAAASLPVL